MEKSLQKFLSKMEKIFKNRKYSSQMKFLLKKLQIFFQKIKFSLKISNFHQKSQIFIQKFQTTFKNLLIVILCEKVIPIF